VSIDHKAWLFDYRAFERELADTLYGALQTGDGRALKAFIDRHSGELTDQWTEERFGPDWEEELRRRPGKPPAEYDVQDYGDIALTKYYDVSDSRGLSYDFDAVHAYLAGLPALADVADALICGYPFGPAGRPFDPGRMGTGFITAGQAKELHGRLRRRLPRPPGPGASVYAGCHYKPRSAEQVSRALACLRGLYEDAAESDRGLLLADFHD
jgi:hypothetical protein